MAVAMNESGPDGIVGGYRACQTQDAKWLSFENIYQKFYRSNFYDIGGTYIGEIADFWFLYKTEVVGDIFLLHLFVNNRQVGSTFNVSVSSGNEIKLDRKQPLAFLPTVMKQCQFRNCREMSQNYLMTYSFTELDVELFKNRILYVAVSFDVNIERAVKQDIIEDVKMSHDFGVLLEETICSDFVIESAEGDKFEVHKVLLIAHSEVFKAMLKDDTAESQNNYVKLVEVCSKELQGILEFIYTGSIKDLENTNFVNLLLLSDQYNLNGLRQLCQYALSQQMNLDNVLDLLTIADMCNSVELKRSAFTYIKYNYESLKRRLFAEVRNVELMRELCEFLVPGE